MLRLMTQLLAASAAQALPAQDLELTQYQGFLDFRDSLSRV